MNSIRIEDSRSGILGRARGVQALAQFLNPKSSRGFTLLELIVVISIIAVLIGAFLSRVPFYQEQAEKNVMEQTAAAMQSVLVMRVGALMARGAVSEQGLQALATDNPIGWLQQEPKNYAGEFFDPALNTVKPGQWLFDLKTRNLIYVPDHVEYFTPVQGGKKWVRFHVRLEYQLPIGKAEGSKKELVSAMFEPTEPYRWMD
jgi:prepilin-type N-terminal cleavage/methylation domain-containing protein